MKPPMPLKMFIFKSAGYYFACYFVCAMYGMFNMVTLLFLYFCVFFALLWNQLRNSVLECSFFSISLSYRPATVLLLDQSVSHIRQSPKLKPFPCKTLFMYGFHILKHRFTPWLCSLPLWQSYCILLLFIFSHFRRMNCPSLSLGSGREFIFVGQVFQNVISDRNHPTRWIQGQTLARLILPSQNTQIQGLCHEDVHSMVGSMQKITTIKYHKAGRIYMWRTTDIF